MVTPSTPPRVERIDVVYAALRIGALLAGLAYPYLSRVPAGASDDVMRAFGAFAAYGVIVYAALAVWLLDPTRRGRFYAVLGGLDLLLVLVLMNLTGGHASPFYRALYLWVAMPAFYFGFRTGTIASAVAFVALVALFDIRGESAWDVLVKAVGLLLHGPVIGFLVDRDRTHLRELSALRARTAATGEPATEHRVAG